MNVIAIRAQNTASHNSCDASCSLHAQSCTHIGGRKHAHSETQTCAQPTVQTHAQKAIHHTYTGIGGFFLVALFLCLLIGLTVPAAPAFAAGNAFASGSGTTEDPYIIETADQLNAFRATVNAGTTFEGNTVKLAADIDVGGSEWTPIGQGFRKSSGATAGSTPFKGVFNGDGHKISNLTITTTSGADYALGLFGILDGGTVSNLQLVNVNIAAEASELAGGAVGLAIDNATVSGITVSGSVSGKAGIGGVVGRMTKTGTIKDCTNSATVQANGIGNAGGIVGAAYYTTKSGSMDITDCTNSGSISGTQAIGGIAGLDASFVGRCHNTGTITAENYSAGGIVGEQKNYGAVNECKNEGAVSTVSSSGYGTGGIVGWARYDGALTAYEATAPITVTNNTNTAAIKGGNDAGGIVGTFYTTGTVTGNTNEASGITATSFAGGIVGNLQIGQVASTLASLKEGIKVENNVSTTALDAIKATFPDRYAYNNSPDEFTVADNGTSWVAQVNDTEFATVAKAVEEAGDGGKAILIANVENASTVTEDTNGTTTLDLNGHSLDFATSPAFKVTSGTLVMMDSGKVRTDGTDLTDLVSEDPSASNEAQLALQGGTYAQDVVAYVDKGFAEYVLHNPADALRFEVLPVRDALQHATAAVTYDGTTRYFENAKDAQRAAAALPGSKLNLFSGSNQGGVDSGEKLPIDQSLATMRDIKRPTLIATATPRSGNLAGTGDVIWPFVLLGVVIAGAAGAIAYYAHRRASS